MTLKDYLSAAIERRASDLHFTVNSPLMTRIDGALVPFDDIKLNDSDILEILRPYVDDKYFETLKDKGEADLAVSIEGIGRFRLNIYHQRGNTAAAIRILNTKIPAPEMLGIPPSVIALTSKRRGLILVTGATGSGKSTTLASLINIINETRPDHIITLEDPIEYLHPHKHSIVEQREMGEDSANYASALRAALRQDPDVILVGEMRDLETISIAVTAAETGHLVLSTLHTIGAANTIDRIIDVFPTHHQQQIRVQLSEVLECVISQQLIPKAFGKGRVAAFEIMHANRAIRSLIREGQTFQAVSVMQTNRKLGMITMDDSLYELYKSGTITRENALRYAQNSAELEKHFEEYGI